MAVSKYSKKDLGHGIRAENARWSFGGSVAKTFTDHVRRSVPLYDLGHDLVCKLSDFHVRADSTCYEIGVSTGELISRLAKHNSRKGAKWIGIDCEKNMILEARKNTSALKNVSFDVADVNLYDFEKSDFIVAYYTIQFIPPKLRQDLINKIFDSLNWGGGFVWFEKIRGNDARFQDIMTTLYNDYKLEIQTGKQNYPGRDNIKDQEFKGSTRAFFPPGGYRLAKEGRVRGYPDNHELHLLPGLPRY